MDPSRLVKSLPFFLARYLLSVENHIAKAVTSFEKSLEPQTRVLDAGCGEGMYRSQFNSHSYIGVDSTIGDSNWNYSQIDMRANIEALPFKNTCFDAAMSIVVLEHTPDPKRALCEISRVLKSRGSLLLVVPQQWEVHQAPNDYFRFTQFGLQYLLQNAGFTTSQIQPLGGFFTLASRRCLNAITFFMQGYRWLVFPLVAAVAIIFALILPLFDGLDRKKQFTLGYICQVEKL